MRKIIAMLGIAGGIAAAVGCAQSSDKGETEEGDEEIGTAVQNQIDIGDKVYWIKQANVIVGAAWGGRVGGVSKEYWVTKPAYSNSATRTFDGSSMSCGTFKRNVCGSSWSGSTYYDATFTQQTLNCALPPGPCTPIAGAVSLLGAGSHRTVDAAGAPFGYTYVSGSCEYWGMQHTITTGQSTQSSLVPGYSSQSNFVTQLCAMSPVPSTYLEAQYSALAAGCSAITC